MDNRKKDLDRIRSDQSTETRKGFRQKLDLENLEGKQEPAGFGTATLKRRTGPGWRRFHGDK